jgi:hypothetical protein
MNVIQVWFRVLWLYISTPIMFWVMLIGIVNLFIWNKLALWTCIPTISFFLTDVISPFFTYILVIISTVIAYYSKYKKTSMDSHIKRAIKSSIPLIFIKLAWNVINAFIVGFESFPDENAGLFPVFLLFFFWIVLYLFASSLIPRYIVDSKNITQFSWIISLNYIRANLWNLIGALFWSLLTASGVMFLLALFFSYLNLSFVLFATPTYVKAFFEELITLTVHVFFIQFLSISTLYIYLKKSKNIKKNIISNLDEMK